MEEKEEKKVSPSGVNSHFRESFYTYQWLDVKDLENTWLEAQIVEIEPLCDEKFDLPNDVYRIKVHYKGWKEKYDEWLSADPTHQDASRIRPLHTHTEPLAEYNRVRLEAGLKLDVMDTTDTWLPAEVRRFHPHRPLVQVHYYGWDDYDEWLPYNSYRIALPGTHTQPGPGAEQSEKKGEATATATATATSTQQPCSPVSNFTASAQNEAKFREELKSRKKFVIVDQDMDGNCLFRSVAHQVYGDNSLHATVRAKCLQYIETQAYFFEAFIYNEDVSSYVTRLKGDGVWGGDVEIQAMSEIYNRPIEIYAYSSTPKRVYRSHLGHLPIRLSYHFQSHYNSVVEPSTFPSSHLNRKPGELEDEYIRKAYRMGRVDGEEDAQKESDREATDLEQLRAALAQSREEFHVGDFQDFESAVADSVKEMEKRWAETVEDAKAQSEREFQDKLILDTVLQNSCATVQQNESQEVEKALQASLQEGMPEAIRRCMGFGYAFESCVEAYSVCSEQHSDQNAIAEHMIQYLLSLASNF